MYRVAAKRWCSNLDNQFRGTTDLPGLSFFQLGSGFGGMWADWRHWPYLSLGMDLGSDGLCGSSALEYRYALNFDRWPDPAQGCHNDVSLMLSRNGLNGFILCMVISWNLKFGPDKDHYTKHQVSECMEAYRSENCPSSSPLFQARLPQLFVDRSVRLSVRISPRLSARPPFRSPVELRRPSCSRVSSLRSTHPLPSFAFFLLFVSSLFAVDAWKTSSSSSGPIRRQRGGTNDAGHCTGIGVFHDSM